MLLILLTFYLSSVIVVVLLALFYTLFIYYLGIFFSPWTYIISTFIGWDWWMQVQKTMFSMVGINQPIVGIIFTLLLGGVIMFFRKIKKKSNLNRCETIENGVIV